MSDDSEYSIDTASRAAAREELADWVGRFLRSPGSDNAELADELSDPPRWWLGPVELPIDELPRLAGPPGDPVLEAVDDDDWRDDVDDLAHLIERGQEAPPVIVTHRDDELALEDGNHRVEALRRAGATHTWAVVGFDDPTARERFVARLGPSHPGPG